MASSRRWAALPFEITTQNETTVISVSGRDRWALEQLILSGPKGCTPIDTPGPRWSAYVHALRNLGVDIETIHEAHGGPFKGTHARYVLRCSVKKLEGAE